MGSWIPATMLLVSKEREFECDGLLMATAVYLGAHYVFNLMYSHPVKENSNVHPEGDFEHPRFKQSGKEYCRTS